MRTKAIAYSYPTSPNAERFGFGAAGCFTVELTELEPQRQPPRAVSAFADIEEAETQAALLPEAWDTYTLRAPSAIHAMRKGGGK